MALTPAVEREVVGKLQDDRRVYLDSGGNIIYPVMPVDENGSAIGNLLKYSISEIDDDASPNYYGFERSNGAWYILKETISPGANTYRYAAGSSDLATSWGNRATTVTYDTFANTF